MLALFTKQKTSRLLGKNVKEAEKLFSATPGFIWHLTREVGKKKDVECDV